MAATGVSLIHHCSARRDNAKLGLKDVGPTLATTVRSVILAALFLGETLRWKSVVGAILMIIGAILVGT